MTKEKVQEREDVVSMGLRVKERWRQVEPSRFLLALSSGLDSFAFQDPHQLVLRGGKVRGVIKQYMRDKEMVECSCSRM